MQTIGFLRPFGAYLRRLLSARQLRRATHGPRCNLTPHSASSSISLLSTFHLSLTSTLFQTKSSAMVLRQERNPLTPEFDALVEKLREEWHIPGLSISIVHGSSTYAKVPPPSTVAIDFGTTLTIMPGLRLCFLSIHTHDHHLPLHNLQHYQSLHRRCNVYGDRR